jgi:predicted alternative tryptophan synthase beta-subunit
LEKNSPILEEKNMNDKVKYLLDESDLPKFWYNIAADLPSPLPAVLHPGTLQPIGPDDLAPLFPMALIMQEVSIERDIEIPQPVRDIYRQWRPSPLYRARRLEKALDTPAKIYYKYEGVSPSGSHKPNTAVPQAFYNKVAGVKKISTETGAGQWGSSLAFAGALFGLEIQVFMVKVSYKLTARNAPPARRTKHNRVGPFWPRIPTATVASASPFPKQWKSRRSATILNMRSARCSITYYYIKLSSAWRR